MAKKKKSVEEQSQDTRSELERMENENKELFEQLTNKNQEYMVKLNRQLEEGNMLAEQRTEIYNDMLKTIVQEQANHLTARKIYGTVTDQARYLLEGKRETKKESGERSETWKLYLDGALLLGGLFSVISGISSFTSENQAGLGIITLLINFLLGGLAVLVITKYAPKPGEKGGFLKYILATTLTMVTWVFLMAMGDVIIPRIINPILPGTVTIIIGGVAFAAKWYLKRKLNIKGTLI